MDKLSIGEFDALFRFIMGNELEHNVRSTSGDYIVVNSKQTKHSEWFYSIRLRRVRHSLYMYTREREVRIMNCFNDEGRSN